MKPQHKRKSLKMDWLGLESRLRAIIPQTHADASNREKAWKEGIFRIDAAIAAFTGRGGYLLDPADVSLSDIVTQEFDFYEANHD